MYKLRDYKKGDESDIFTLLKIALQEYGLSVDPKGTDADIKDIYASYILPGGAFKVLEDNGKIVGSYGLLKISNTTCELRKMYLYPEYKGKGLGKKMMDDLFLTVTSLGFTKIVLETNSSLKEAINLYKKYGFTEYNPEHLSDRCNYAMEKEL
ncbi:MAG: GNAT family N-acetyltransferase [Melioribacteraceae bacterium]|nr:GNAT family N-acetyltransferase [Melioribacteraceae bacterium]